MKYTYQTCPRCGGTGRRDDILAYRPCPRCGGTGAVKVWIVAVADDNDNSQTTCENIYISASESD